MHGPDVNIYVVIYEEMMMTPTSKFIAYKEGCWFTYSDQEISLMEHPYSYELFYGYMVSPRPVHEALI